MSTASLLPMPRAVFYDANGNPLAAGLVYTFIANTTTPKTTWQDAGETTPNSNPIVLDANGSCLLYGAGSYTITVTDAIGNNIPAYSGLTFTTGNFIFTNIAALRANTNLGSGFGSVYVDGYTTAADGGQGNFVYVASDTTSSDNGGTIIVDAVGQRWYRDTQGLQNSVRWFGAKGDGVTDDTTAFNNAINAGNYARVPLHTTTGYLINGTVTIGTGQWLVIESPDVMFIANASSTTNNPFRLTGLGDFPTTTSGITGGGVFNLNGTTNGTAIRFGTSSGLVWGVRLIGRFSFENCFEAIGDEASSSNYVVDATIDDVWCRLTTGRQVYIRRSRGFLVFNSIYIDQGVNASAITWEGARFEDLIGLELNRFDVATGGLSTPAYQASVTGLIINGTGQSGAQNSYVIIRRCLIDNTMGNGVLLNNLMNVQISDMTTYQNLGFGISVVACTRVQMNNIEIVGGNNLPGAGLGLHGIEFNGCDRVEVSNIISESNSADGIYLHNTMRSRIVNWEAFSNDNIGWVEDGTSNLNISTNGLSYSNTTDSLSQVGTDSASCNWIPNSGAFRASDVGPITV